MFHLFSLLSNSSIGEGGKRKMMAITHANGARNWDDPSTIPNDCIAGFFLRTFLGK
jgi:hypothetical protein